MSSILDTIEDNLKNRDIELLRRSLIDLLEEVKKLEIEYSNVISALSTIYRELNNKVDLSHLIMKCVKYIKTLKVKYEK